MINVHAHHVGVESRKDAFSRSASRKRSAFTEQGSQYVHTIQVVHVIHGWALPVEGKIHRLIALFWVCHHAASGHKLGSGVIDWQLAEFWQMSKMLVSKLHEFAMFDGRSRNDHVRANMHVCAQIIK